MPPARRKSPLTRTQRLAAFIDRTLLPDLRARATEPAIADTLRARWDFERSSRRTAAPLPEWTDQTLTQVAVAWVLSCVFVRVLEDRDLVPHARLAGRDARDSEQLFYEQFSQLGPRDYVLTVFTEVSRSPITENLLGPANNPAWTLGPSHDAVRELLTLLRDASADGTLSLRFDAPDTRFLGDLYQDLSADVRERFALLQTPDFVESFILDHTLEPAIAEFSLLNLRAIDPTCGSGHFLLGAFRRIFNRLRAERPHDDPRALITESLAKVYGSDINPYAVAIARFRLLLDAISLGGFTKLADAPALPALTRNVVVADSLLLGAKGTKDLAELALDAASQSQWGPRAFDFQDPPAVNAVFRQRYHAVVGNPPYITCKDAALRETYRAGYPDSAQKQYALAAPFTERFFTLAVDHGFVGLINANSFMKREFGKGLVEKVLPKFDLTHVIDTSGAYIPGHDTPTVILFGRNRRPAQSTLRAVLGRRGEPETPSDPTKGKVWSSIAGRIGTAGFENEFITVTDTDRESLKRHPWSLGGGGATELKELIESRLARRLRDVSISIGRTNVCGEDDAWIYPRGTHERFVADPYLATFVEGEVVRDWWIDPSTKAIYPYVQLGGEPVAPDSPIVTHILWPVRAILRARTVFGKSVEERGKWYEHLEHYADRLRTPLSIVFAFVATHNHFVLDRGGKVFKHSAPIIKLHNGASEADYLALTASLNSSTTCFWIKSTCYAAAAASKDIDAEKGRPESNRYQIASSAIEPLPIIALDSPSASALASFAQEIESLAARRASFDPASMLTHLSQITNSSLHEALMRAENSASDCLRAMVVVQEDLDWHFYAALGLCPHTGTTFGGAAPDERPYLWPSLDAPESLDPELRDLWTHRRRIIEESPQIRLLEDAMYKRPWEGRRGIFGHGVLTWEERVYKACEEWILDRVEALLREHERPVSMSELEMDLLRDPKDNAVIEVLSKKHGDNVTAMLSALADSASIPFLAALRHTDEGLAKRTRWEHTWDLQRREDRGEAVGEIPVPPKYDREDYRDPRYWSLRGKLDVPRERFIAYPGAETDPKAPLFGWAGWNHLQRARALASLYQQRKTVDGWDAPRLLPILAGLRELLFWITLWHDDPDPELDGLRQGSVWSEFIEGERAFLGCSDEDLRAWRPAAKTRKGRAKG